MSDVNRCPTCNRPACLQFGQTLEENINYCPFCMTKDIAQIRNILDAVDGEDGCGQFKTYNAALNELRGQIQATDDKLYSEVFALDSELARLADRIGKSGRTPTELLRQWAGTWLRELAFRLDGQP